MGWRWFHEWGSPKWFYDRAGRWQRVCGFLALALLLVGTLWGLGFAPADYQQGNSYRIIYLHVPVAFLAQALYVAMAVCAIVLFVWKMKLADVGMQALAVSVPNDVMIALLVTLLLATPALTCFSALGAALTLGTARSGILGVLVMLPLFVPVIILAAGVLTRASDGSDILPLLALLGAFSIAAATLLPLAVGVALRLNIGGSS